MAAKVLEMGKRGPGWDQKGAGTRMVEPTQVLTGSRRRLERSSERFRSEMRVVLHQIRCVAVPCLARSLVSVSYDFTCLRSARRLRRLPRL